jgi:hypothetical protein
MVLGVTAAQLAPGKLITMHCKAQIKSTHMSLGSKQQPHSPMQYQSNCQQSKPTHHHCSRTLNSLGCSDAWHEQAAAAMTQQSINLADASVAAR